MQLVLRSPRIGALAVLRRAPLGLWFSFVAMVAAPVLLVELTGVLGGLMTGRGPVVVDPISAYGVFAHWLGDTGVRRGAWPSDVAPQLGRHRQLRAVLLLSLVLAAGVAVMVWSLWRSMRVERLREVYRERGARWANERELKSLQVRGATPGRLILGTRDGKLLAAEDNASTLIIAPSQAGKTTGLAVPAMVEWEGPILATSVKGDLLVDTIQARRAIGEVKVFDPTDATEVEGSGWSPVAAATNWTASRRVASSILQIGMRHHGGQDDSFWRQAGASYLAPLLLAGNHLGADTSDVLEWATSTDDDAVEAATIKLTELTALKVPGARTALHDLKTLWGVDSRYRSSVIGTLSTHLDAWKEPELARATRADPNGITPEWLLDGNNTLYLSAPAAEQRRLRGLFSALVIEVVAAAFARAARTGRPLDRKLLTLMDEAGNIAPLPNIDEIASTGPGQGVLLVTILQNLSQAEEVWGKDRADTILANHRARLFGSGIADTATLEYIGKVLGDEARQSSSISRKRGAIFDFGSRSESLEHRQLLGNHEMRQLGQGKALLVYGQLPPTQVALRPWYKDRRLTALVQGIGRRPVPAASPRSQENVPLGTQRAPESSAGEQAPTVVDEPRLAAAETTVPAARELKDLDGQLTLEEALAHAEPLDPAGTAGELVFVAGGAPAAGGVGLVSPAGDPDPRGHMERALGLSAAAATVAGLRLAAGFADVSALDGGPLAVVLTGGSASIPAERAGVVELVAGEADREPLAVRLMGAGCSMTEEVVAGKPRERWTGPAMEQLSVRYVTGHEEVEAIAAATDLEVDGAGVVRAVGVAPPASQAQRDSGADDW